MPKDKARIQAVRPFHPKALDKQPDLKFATWLKSTAGPYSLEIGAGVGWHSIQWARSHPNESLISLERTKNKFARFEQRRAHHELNNLFISGQDALHWCPQNLQSINLENIFLLYPNPYPKEKQANKRWHRASLFHFLFDRLSPGGKVYLATNEEFYAKEAKLYFQNFWNLKTESAKELTQSNFSNPRTHFEKKYLLRGQKLFDFVFCKKESKPS